MNKKITFCFLDMQFYYFTRNIHTPLGSGRPDGEDWLVSYKVEKEAKINLRSSCLITTNCYEYVVLKTIFYYSFDKYENIKIILSNHVLLLILCL